MAVASLFGGFALSNAGLGAVHGFAGPIGGSFSAPHGAICAALLPHVMAMNLRALRQRDSHGAGVVSLRGGGLVAGRRHEGQGRRRREMGSRPGPRFEIPRLGSFGVQREHFPELVAKAANASSMKANPIVLTPEELTEILESAL